MSFERFKVGFGFLLVDRCLEVIETAIFIQIGFGDMGVHEGDELRFIHPEESHKGGDFLILCLVLIVGEVIAEGAVGVDLDVAALDVVEENLGDSLLFLGER